jgi:hypothetical protein
MSGFMSVFPPEVGLQIAMANLAAVRERALALGVATEQQFDEVMGGLSAAMKAKDSYDWIASWVWIKSQCWGTPMVERLPAFLPRSTPSTSADLSSWPQALQRIPPRRSTLK